MRRSKLVVSCTALLLALPGVAVPAAALAASPATAIKPAAGHSVVASGIVVRGGTPENGASISVFAKPTPGALARAGATGLRLLPLGQSSATSSGQFAISGDLAGLPGNYRGSQGGVDILLVTTDAVSSIVWSYTLYPSGSKISDGFIAPAAGVAAPLSGRYADGRTAPATHIDLASGSVWDLGNDPATWLDASGRPLGKTAHSDLSRRVAITAPQPGLAKYAQVFLAATTRERITMLDVHSSSRTSRPSDPKATGCGVIVWVNAYKTNVQEHYLNVYSSGGATVTVEEGVNGSMSATLGIVAQSVGGSLSLGGSTGKTWNLDVSQTGVADASVSNRINYREQVISCVLGATWQPYSTYDLLTDWAYAPHVNYSNCSPRLAGTKWATSTARNATWSYGVSFPGFSVSAQSGYGSSQQLTYDFAVKGFICGNSTQGPASSPQVSAHA